MFDNFSLPTSIEIEGREFPIRSDFRPALEILMAFEDQELTIEEKFFVLLKILYVDNIPPTHQQQAVELGVLFLNMNDTSSAGESSAPDLGRLYSWKHDARFIFSAVDKVLGYSSRSCEYLHYWDFIGAFMELGECTFSTLVHYRRLKKLGKMKKEDWDWWRENKHIAELKEELSAAEQAEVEAKLKEFE